MIHPLNSIKNIQIQYRRKICYHILKKKIIHNYCFNKKLEKICHVLSKKVILLITLYKLNLTSSERKILL